MRHLALLFLVGTAVFAFVHMGMWYPSLPDEVPTHFNGEGVADKWGTKTEHYGIHLALHISNLVLFLALGFGMKFLPDSVINMPNKDYWLAPERRSDTLASQQALLLFIGAATSWLFIAIFELSSQVAAGTRNGIGPEFWFALLGYLAIVFGFVGYQFFKFRLPDSIQTPAA